MIDSSAAWVTATISVALTALLFVIIQLTKTPARSSHPRLAKVRTVTRRELGSSTEPLSPGIRPIEDWFGLRPRITSLNRLIEADLPD
jgi:hypothetical protein